MKRGRKRKAQVSIEYIMIFGFAIAVVLPFIYYFFVYSQGPAQNTNANQAQLVARKIVDNAEMVYSIGEGTRTTFKAYLPENVLDSQIVENEVIFSVQTGPAPSHIGFPSRVNITGSVPNSSGIHFIHVEAFEDYVNISYT